MLSASQCPKCELLFAIRNQLDDHLVHDHPQFQHVYQPNSARAELAAATATASVASSGRPRHVLVVANQTLGSENLLQLVKSRVAAGPCDFSIVLPSATPAGQSFDAAQPHLNGEDSETADQHRLSDAKRRFAGVGAAVDGRLGDADPLMAVTSALSSGAFDEVIISTLPRSASRWWRQDLATKVQRKSHLPVTVVSAEGSQPAR